MNKNVVTPGFKLKRLALYAVMSMLVMFAGILAACDNSVNNLKLETSVQEVTLYLDNNGGEKASLSVFASGANDDVHADIYIHSSSNAVKVSDKKYMGGGRTDFSVTGIAQEDNITILVQSNRNLKKATEVKVKVVDPVVSISKTPSDFKNYVIKGSSTPLSASMVRFTPTHTFETDLVFTIKDNPAPAQIRIENNRLVVDPTLPDAIKSIEVIASSVHRQISGVSFEFSILNKLEKEDLSIIATTTTTNLKEDGAVVYLARNSGNIQNEIIEVQVDTAHLTSVKPILVNEFGSIQPLKAQFAEVVRQSYNSNTKVFSFEIAPGTVAGKGYIYFEIELAEFGYKYSTESFKTQIFAYDVVKNILVNNQIAADSANYKIFSEYADGFAGHEFVFSALPITVAEEYKNFYIETLDYLPNNLENSKIFIYKTNQATNQLDLLMPTNSKLKIEDGERIYILANRNTVANFASITVVSEFSASFHPGTTEEKRTTLNFNIVRGVAGAEAYGFVQGMQEVVVLNSDSNLAQPDQQKFYFAVTHEDADLLDHTTFAVEGNFAVKPNSLVKEYFDASIPAEEFETAGKALWSVTLVSLKDNSATTGRLVVNFGNGRTLAIQVQTAVEFKGNALQISSQRQHESTAVGQYQQNPNNYTSFAVAIKQGQSARIASNLDAKTYKAEFSYLNAPFLADEDSLYQNIANFTYDTILSLSSQFVASSNIINSTDLDGYGVISAVQTGKVLVKAVYTGKVFDIFGKYQVLRDVELGEEVVKYFFVEVYTPIVNFDAKITNNLLYTADTVGFYNRNLSQTSVTTTVNFGFSQPTYSTVTVHVVGLVEGVQVRVEQSSTNKNLYTITALTTMRNQDDVPVYENRDGTLEFRITELNQTRVVRIPLILRNAEKVQDIELENVNQGEGIYLHVDKDTSFKINARSKNLTAFNSNFLYFFEADFGVENANDILTISENTGQITLKGTKIGGTGVVKVIPQDAFIVNALGQRELSSTNTVAKTFKIVIADGKTKETATRISALSEIEETDKHYVLVSNTAVSNWVSISEFSGGLYGRLSEERPMAQISLNRLTPSSNSGAIFGTLLQGAVVEDLVIVGEVYGSSTGFVANTNNGTINNITIETKTSSGTYLPSTITSTSTDAVGGIVGVNQAQGVVNNSSFFGKVVATSANYAGGIVGDNLGIVQNSKAEFYTFEENQFGSVAASGYAGGIVGRLNNGKIVLSYAYSYHNEDSLFASSLGAIVGLVSGASAQVSKSFARTNAQFFVGNENAVSNGKIVFNFSNSYQFYYQTVGAEETLVETFRTISANRDVFYDAIKYQYGSPTFTSSYQAHGIAFGSASAWTYSLTNNNGYPYLKEILNEQVSLNQNMNLLAGENVLVDTNQNQAVFYLYQPVGGNVGLTSQEQAIVKNWNTHSFAKLFGVSNSNGIKAVVGGAGSNSVRVLSNSIELLQPATNLTLDVFSKYDYTQKISFTISIIYAPGTFELTLDNNPVNKNSVVNVKGGITQNIHSSFTTSKVVLNRVISFMQNSGFVSELVTKLEADNAQGMISSTTAFVHIVDTTKFGEGKSFITFNAYGKFATLPVGAEYVNSLLKQALNVEFALSTYQGPFEISTNVKEIIRAMPYDKISFEVEVISDNKNEEIKLLLTDENGLSHFTNGVAYNSLFTSDISAIQKHGSEIDLGNGKFKLTYKIDLEIADAYKNLNFNNVFLFIEIKSTTYDAVSAYVDLILASQEIQYINMFSRELDRYYPDFGFMFKNQVSNNIAPGKNALLTLDLFPTLAYFETLEITSSVVDGQRISFSLLEEVDGKLQRKKGGFRAILNGISVNQSVLTQSANQPRLSSLYIYATVPSTVLLETTFTVFVKAFGTNNELLPNANSEFIIVAKPMIAASITVNNANTAIVAKGTKAQIKVEMEEGQWLGNDGFLELFVDNSTNEFAYFEGISISKPVESFNEVTKKRTYTAEVDVSVIARFFNTPNHSFDVVATIERRVGNVTETITSSVKIYVVDFLVDFNSIKVKSDSRNENMIETYIGVSKLVEFDIQTTTWQNNNPAFPEIDQAIEELEGIVANFKNRNHHYWEDPLNPNSKYIVNYHQTGVNNSNVFKNYLNNLYYVNANGSTTKVLSANGTVISSDILNFVFLDGNGVASNEPAGKTLRIEGKRTGTQNLRLMFEVLNPDGTRQQFAYNFSVVVTNYTDEDKPEQIYSAADFMAIANEQTPQDYILMEDIYLYEYVPFATSRIRSFDGNNKVISIMSFDLDLEPNSTAISLALFTTVTENTTLKNITVNYYHLNKVLINTAKFRTINIAGFAIENRGIITNSHVLAAKFNPNLPNTTKTNLGFEVVYSSGSTETKISQNIASTISGFVITNTSGANITNSRVGGVEFTKVMISQNQTSIYPLGIFTLSGQGSVVGFVFTNSGNISASFANNINIENQSDVKRETVTSGFAGTNNGKITLSYSKGAYNTLYPNEIRASGSGISTTGIASGFVYTNNGTISDSYSNIMIQDKNGNSGRGSAGFVYSNTQTGVIEKAYTASLTQDRNSSQMNFTGVDEKLEILNAGKIINSYYYSPQASGQESSSEVEELYASGVLKISSFTNLEAFYGFSFATVNSNDGVWKATSGRGIDLVSANEIAISSRYLQNLSGDFVFRYAEGYQYGSKVNPIIIRTAQEFNNVMGAETNSTPIQEQFDLQRKEIYGSYRLVSDINLSELSATPTSDYKFASTGMSLVDGAMFDGNNLTISNLQMYSTLEYTKKSIGMFATVEQGSIIKNLNVGLITIEANNVENVGAVTGALVDSKLVNISVKAMAADSSAKILGQNIVGGVVGIVSGNSAIVGLLTENVSVEVDFYDRNIARQHFQRKLVFAEANHSRLSFAGGIVGVLDIFTPDKFGQEEFFKEDILSFANSASLHVKGYNEIKAGTVGGVIGYVGINTFVRDASYEIYAEHTTRAQNIVSYKYAAGGVVGQLNGSLTQSKIEHAPALQAQIEKDMSVYYLTSQTVSRGNMRLFKNTTTVYEPIFVGGLVGKIGSGEITNSYSKANVVMETASFVGGVVGGIGDFQYANAATIKRVGNIMIEEVYGFGDIRSASGANKGAGGFAGFVQFIKANTLDSSNMPIQLIVDGANAIVYHSKDVAGMFDQTIDGNVLKNVYDFYAYTYLENNFVSATDFATKVEQKINSQDKLNDILSLTEFTIGQNTSSVIQSYATKDFQVGQNTVYKLKESTFGVVGETENNVTVYSPRKINGRVTRLNEIVNLEADARVMDVIFRNNFWNPEKWERETGQLLPKILFTVSSSIFYIEKPEDFLLMRENPDKIFIIIGGALDGQQRRLIDMSAFSSSDLEEAIRNFSGILKGQVDEDDGNGEIKEPKYGFKNLNISKALIESTRNGAVFSDFIISQSGTANQDGAILVKEAEGTIFRNIIIENASLTTTALNSGLLVGKAKNSIFDTIKIDSALNRDMVRLNIETNASTANRPNEEYSVGVLVGSVDSSIKTTFRNVEIKNINQSYGVRVGGSTNTASETVKTVNMGGLFGKASQGVDISLEKGNEDFINKIGLNFDSGNIGSGNVLLKDFYVLNAGAIGGSADGGTLSVRSDDMSRSVHAKMVINGTFKAANTGVSASVGGLFGKVSGLSIPTQTAREFVSEVQIGLLNKIEGTDVNAPRMAVGGAVGQATASVNLKNVKFSSHKIVKLGTEFEPREMISVNSKKNIVYAGGIVGYTQEQTFLENAEVSSGVKLKVVDSTTSNSTALSSATVGGIVGQSAYSRNSSSIQLYAKTNTFNGFVEILNTNIVTAGGIIGGMSRQTYIGGFGSIMGSVVNENNFGGQIDVERTTNSKFVLGGIVGSTAVGAANPTQVNNPVEVNSNVAYGDINIVTKAVGQGSLVLGGIVAESSGSTTVSNNISLATLFSTRTSVEDTGHLSKAVVGNGIYSAISSGNMYSSQINLATDSQALAENMLYGSILNEINNLEELLSGQHSALNKNATGGTIYGYKLRPYILATAQDIAENVSNKGQNGLSRTYFKLKGVLEDVLEDQTSSSETRRSIFEFDLENPIELTGQDKKQNQAFIGDGVTVKISKNSATSSKASRMFDLIDEKSFVSGISVAIDAYYYPETYSYTYTKFEQTGLQTIAYPYQIYGGLAAVNKGVIYGANVQSGKKASQILNSENINGENIYADIYADIVLTNTTLAGGLVGLNQGYIADSFTSVSLTNFTSVSKQANTTGEASLFTQLLTNHANHVKNIVIDQNEFYIRAVTSGFVGINEGDINSSYSSGVISAYNSVVYSFGADSKNIKFAGLPNQNLVEPTVKNSFAFAQASKAFTNVELLEEAEEKTFSTNNTLYSNVFGYGANNSNFYDIYATEVAQKNNELVNKYTTAKAMMLEQLGGNFDYVGGINFGYPTFAKAYEAKEFNFMRFEFSSSLNQQNPATNTISAFVPNLGVLQLVVSQIASQSRTNRLEIHLLSDMQITKDMGYVSNTENFIKVEDIDSSIKGSNWEVHSIKDTSLFGHGKTISGVKLFSGSEGILGFFKQIEGSKISNLTLANGEVVYTRQEASNTSISLGAFAGRMVDYNNANIITGSVIENSSNLGVRVQSNYGGEVGGIVGSVYGVNSSLTKNTNAGTVVSSLNIDDVATNAYFLGYAYAGGIFGRYSNGDTAGLANINHNINLGFVYANGYEVYEQKAEEEEGAEAELTVKAQVLAAGMGHGDPSIGSKEFIENLNVFNINNGVLKAYINSVVVNNGQIVARTLVDATGQAAHTYNTIYGVKNETGEAILTPNRNPNNSGNLIGEGTKVSPFIIANIEDFNEAYSRYTTSQKLNIALLTDINLDMANITIEEYQYFKDIDNSEINIFGNDKILEYSFGSKGQSIYDFALFEEIGAHSSITNTKVLGVILNTTINTTFIAKENKGLIKQTDVYGTINVEDVYGTINVENTIDGIGSSIFAGHTIKNFENGRIELSNNYSVIKAANGVDETSSTEASSAINIGGISGVSLGTILDSNNFGALIGGNGGNGFSYDGSSEQRQAKAANGLSGNQAEPGKDGKNGGNAGNASIIGGVTYLVDDEALQNVVIGQNFGIIIGGNGGNGGQGQAGGNGGNAIEDYNALIGALNLILRVTSISAAQDLWNQHFGSLPVAKDGGAGGAGGNGGNTIVGQIAGVSNSINVFENENLKTISNPIVIEGKPGKGGVGGNGGHGGSGRLQSEWTSILKTIITVMYPGAGAAVNLFISDMKFIGHGNGGGSGGSGFSGNTFEALTTQFSDGIEFYAEKGGGYVDDVYDATIEGYGAAREYSQDQQGKNPFGQKGEEKNLMLSNAVDLPWFFTTEDGEQLTMPYYQFLTEYDKPRGGVAPTESAEFAMPTGGAVGFSTRLPELVDGNKYMVNTWMDLLGLLYKSNLEPENFEDKEYHLKKDFNFGTGQGQDAQILQPLPKFSGKIVGNNHTITVKGQYRDFKLTNSNTGVVENLTLNLDITGFDSKFVSNNQFVSPNFASGNINNVTISGKVRAVKTKAMMELVYGIAPLPASSVFETKASFITGNGTELNPYKINQAAFAEFVELANAGSKAFFELTQNITVTATRNTSGYVIKQFLGSLYGNDHTVLIGTYSDTDLGLEIAYEGFIETIGSDSYADAIVSSLIVRGGFHTSAIAQTNYGLIYSVRTGLTVTQNQTRDSVTSKGQTLAGFVVTNRGVISNSTNNFNLTSNGDTAGIAISNHGLIENTTNYGNITAGNGNTGKLFDELSEDIKKIYEQSVYQNDPAGLEQFKLTLLNGGKGFDAAGIVIYNYIERVANEEEYLGENNIVLFGLSNVRNDGNITGGQGGEGITDPDLEVTGTVGNGGSAAGIAIYNIIEAVDDSEQTVYYKGYISQNSVNNGVIAGGTGLVNGPSDSIVVVNSITGSDNQVHTGYPQPEED